MEADRLDTEFSSWAMSCRFCEVTHLLTGCWVISQTNVNQNQRAASQALPRKTHTENNNNMNMGSWLMMQFVVNCEYIYQS